METNRFGDWLANQLRRRELSQADFSRTTGFGTGTISRWIANARVPDPDSCDRIADALHIDVETVLRKAGHLPEVESVDEFAEEIMALVKRIHWTAERVAIIRGSLQGMIRMDEDQKRAR